MRQDDRVPFLDALRQARSAAYPVGQYVGQESFMRATEIRRLARRAGIGPGVSVLDVCCGIAGPGRLIAAETGCRYLGVDYSAGALDIARDLAGDLQCRFELMHVPPLPDEQFEVVLLLETLLAFPDKRSLLESVARALESGGRFAVTVEVGAPLTATERARMPDADTVWLVEWSDWTSLLSEVGLRVTWQDDCTMSHHATASALHQAYRADAAEISRRIGSRALDELITAHELWTDWLGSGRVLKFAQVVGKR